MGCGSGTGTAWRRGREPVGPPPKTGDTGQGDEDYAQDHDAHSPADGEPGN